MPDTQNNALRFESHRPHLIAVATRLLGSSAEAEDAVQEAWFRLDRSGEEGIANLGGWLTTVVSRICLDHLRTRSSRREDPVADAMPEPGDADPTPEDTAIISESTAEALAVVLDTLAPAERLAFVLHDLFGVPFDEIAVILDRSPDATRQLASRARRRVRGASPPREADVERQREVVTAFLRASRGGDFEALLKLLDPEVVVRADATSVRMGSEAEVRGATAVLNTFLGRAVGAQPAIIQGNAGAAWAPGGQLRALIAFTVAGGKITAIDLLADQDRLDQLDVVLLPKEKAPPPSPRANPKRLAKNKPTVGEE